MIIIAVLLNIPTVYKTVQLRSSLMNNNMLFTSVLIKEQCLKEMERTNLHNECFYFDTLST